MRIDYQERKRARNRRTNFASDSTGGCISTPTIVYEYVVLPWPFLEILRRLRALALVASLTVHFRRLEEHLCYFETGFAFYSRDEINNTCGLAAWRQVQIAFIDMVMRSEL